MSPAADGSAVVAEDSTEAGLAEPGEKTSSSSKPPAPIPAAWALPTVGLFVLTLDQATKYWALRNLEDGPIDIIGSLRLNLAFNTGAAFSEGSGFGPFIAVLVLVIVVVLILARRRIIDSAWSTVAVGMIAGGALGNLTDRLFRAGDGFLGGAVVDFVDVQWWPIFNVADAAVVLGGLLLVFESMRADSNLGK